MIYIKPKDEEDNGWVERLLCENWGSGIIVTRGRIHDAAVLPGFIAEDDGAPAGLITYEINGFECEIVSLDSIVENKGMGSSLIEAVLKAAREKGCSRVWLITSNDNTRAMRFYQKRGFSFAAIHIGAISEARAIKPQIPLLGFDGIPIRDEIEFEIRLDRTFNC